MKNVKNHNYYKWSVENGDYKRDDEATISYQKKLNTKRKIKTFFIIMAYFAAVSVLSYFIFTQL